VSYKIVTYILLGLGVFMGAFFGVMPGLLLDTAFLTRCVSQDVASNRGFFLFATIYGYISMFLVAIIIVSKVLGRVLRKKKFEEQIRLVVFANGKGTIDRARLRKITGLVEEELLRMFPASRDSFTFEEFGQARKLAKTIGIKPCDDASGLFRI
jgi:hypothetical protein